MIPIPAVSNYVSRYGVERYREKDHISEPPRQEATDVDLFGFGPLGGFSYPLPSVNPALSGSDLFTCLGLDDGVQRSSARSEFVSGHPRLANAISFRR